MPVTLSLMRYPGVVYMLAIVIRSTRSLEYVNDTRIQVTWASRHVNNRGHVVAAAVFIVTMLNVSAKRITRFNHSCIYIPPYTFFPAHPLFIYFSISTIQVLFTIVPVNRVYSWSCAKGQRSWMKVKSRQICNVIWL